MTQSIARPLTGQLVTYRHQVLAAPTILDENPLAPSHVAGVGVGHMTCYTFGKPYLPTFHMAFKVNITRAEVPTSIKESCCGNMAIRRV